MPSLHDILLALHVVAGAGGIALGPLALWRSRGRPALVAGGIGWAYVGAVLAVSLTGVGLVALSWSELWWLTILAAVSSALAVLAVLAPRVRFRGWARACAHGEGGSYIALVTALLVVSVDGPASLAAWTLPTLAGLPLIEVRAARLRAAMTEDSEQPTDPRSQPATEGAKWERSSQRNT